MWKVLATEEYSEWMTGLGEDDQIRLAARVEKLREHGSGLGRPLVDSISYRKNIPIADDLYEQHLKDLESKGGN